MLYIDAFNADLTIEEEQEDAESKLSEKIVWIILF